MILLFLLLSILRHLTAGNQPYGGKDKGFGLPLLISAHLTLLIGLYQWAAGNMGLNFITENGMGAVMNGMSVHGGFIPYGATFLVFARTRRRIVHYL